ncbi:hypothetical protein DMH08_13700 [Actinomadura sp. WAC 06369]|nr:hypothetical protein DMH08_13700 [Actinomadura sp. WAC 06369]
MDSRVRASRPHRSSRNPECCPTPAPTTGWATWSSSVARPVSAPRQSPAYRQVRESGPGMAPAVMGRTSRSVMAASGRRSDV